MKVIQITQNIFYQYFEGLIYSLEIDFIVWGPHNVELIF